MYVSSLVDHVPPKYSKKTAKTKRTGTFIYHLRVRGDKLQVCKTMFMNTLGIGEWCVRDWVLKSVRVHGMHTRNIGADKREKVLTAREFLESLTELPSHYCRKDSLKMYLETVITSRTHLIKVFQEYCDSEGNLRVSRQVLLKEMKIQNIAIYKPPKKISAVCVLDINMALSPNRTSGSMKREKKNQNRKGIMINRRPKETITSWFSP